MGGWKAAPPPHTAAVSYFGSVMLQALLSLPSSTPLVSALLALPADAFLHLASNARGAHVLESVLAVGHASGFSHSLTHQHALVDLVIAHLLPLSHSVAGSFLVEKAYRAADSQRKRTISSQLASQQKTLQRSKSGQALLRTCGLVSGKPSIDVSPSHHPDLPLIHSTPLFCGHHCHGGVGFPCDSPADDRIEFDCGHLGTERAVNRNWPWLPRAGDRRHPHPSTSHHTSRTTSVEYHTSHPVHHSSVPSLPLLLWMWRSVGRWRRASGARRLCSQTSWRMSEGRLCMMSALAVHFLYDTTTDCTPSLMSSFVHWLSQLQRGHLPFNMSCVPLADAMYRIREVLQ